MKPCIHVGPSRESFEAASAAIIKVVVACKGCEGETCRKALDVLEKVAELPNAVTIANNAFYQTIDEKPNKK